MLIRSASWLVLPIFIISLSGVFNMAESKSTGSKKQKEAIKQPAKKPANIDGFRSAKFGMKEKDVYRAVAKDFKISKSKVKQNSNALEKTRSLKIDLPKLLEIGGPAQIIYIFGYSSKKLEVVNIIWGSSVSESEKVDFQGVVDAANFLRTHLLKKQYEEGVVANYKMDENTTIVFRGRDKKNRMSVLTLSTVDAIKTKDEKSASKEIILKLSYISHPDNPDIFKIKDDDF